VNWFRSSH